jgi:hypothetical protein
MRFGGCPISRGVGEKWGPEGGTSVISGEVVKTGAGNAMLTKEPPSPLQQASLIRNGSVP